MKLTEKLNKMTNEELKENMKRIDKKLESLTESLSSAEQTKLIREYNMSSLVLIRRNPLTTEPSDL